MYPQPLDASLGNDYLKSNCLGNVNAFRVEKNYTLTCNTKFVKFSARKHRTTASFVIVSRGRTMGSSFDRTY